MVIRRLVEIFPNLEYLGLNGDFSNINDVWPSGHFTKLHSFMSYDSSANTCMIPLPASSYRELICVPELMVRGIKDEKFKPQRVLTLTLNMINCEIDGKELGGLLA